MREQQSIRFTVDHLSTRNIISIEMMGKLPKDSVLNEGKIVKDKKLKIVKILLDDVDIKNYIYKKLNLILYSTT